MAFSPVSFDGLRVDGLEYQLDDTNSAAGAAGALADSLSLETDVFLEEVRFHLSDVVTTDENFTISLASANGTAGTEFDVNLLTVDMGSDADGTPDVVTDMVWRPIRPIRITKENAIACAFANTEARTWGLSVVLRKGRK